MSIEDLSKQRRAFAKTNVPHKCAICSSMVCMYSQPIYAGLLYLIQPLFTGEFHKQRQVYQSVDCYCSYFVFLLQASPEHLLSAAIMSAPAALAMAKLSYPETEVSVTRTEEEVYIPPWSVAYIIINQKHLTLSITASSFGTCETV